MTTGRSGLSFGWEDEAPKEQASERDYGALGLPSNPFVEIPESAVNPPMYRDYIAVELRAISKWMRESYEVASRKPLSLIGGIGMGKTYLLRSSEAQLREQQDAARLLVFRVSLYDYGVQHISLGGLLWSKLREAKLSSWVQAPGGAETVLVPLIWQLVEQEGVEETAPRSLMEQHIRQIRALSTKAQQLERAKLLCRWLSRADLTSKEYRELGETRKIDWEGELLTYLCDLFGVADRFGVCKRVYFMVDQLEDLFRPNITAMRRARLLTDLRHLIDEVIDHGAPIALVLAWSTELENGRGRPDNITTQFSEKYPALMERLQSGTPINLPPLEQKHREPFAMTYIEALSKVAGYNYRVIMEMLPRLVTRASALASADKIGPFEPISPRLWHMYLRRAMEELAEEAAKKIR